MMLHFNYSEIASSHKLMDKQEHADAVQRAAVHANVVRWTQFLATTAGRDKACRFVQYFCRLLSYYAAKNTASSAIATRLAKLSAAVGMARKRT